MDGLFLVNKPQGVSSRKVGAALQKSLKLNKVGHVGTLDLDASGLLLILSNSATRLQNYFLYHDKTYHGKIILGATSDTDDIFGNIEWHPSRYSFEIDHESFITKVKETFSPEYYQKPCVVSSKKVNGVTSRKLVEQGIIPDLKECLVRVKFNSLAPIGVLDFAYDVTVSSGFYVRALARDMGSLLGIGGIAESIDRSRIGPFSSAHAIIPNLDEDFVTFEDAMISEERLQSSFIPISKLHRYLSFPKISLEDDLIEKFKKGNKTVLQFLENNILQRSAEHFFVIDSNDSLLGVISYKKETNVLGFDLVL